MQFCHKGYTVFAFSDTCGHHRNLKVPENADVVICAGNAVEDELKGREYDDFIEWFAGLPAKWKLFIPGTCEMSFSMGQCDEIVRAMSAKGITCLQDAVEDCDGIIIGAISGNLKIADEDIPTDLDMLVTHCPPYGILDDGLGSPDILRFVLKSKPLYHLFGHVRVTEGQSLRRGQTFYANASCFFRASVPRLQGPAGKFLPGICRWIKNGELVLDSERACEILNIFLHILEDHPAFYFFDEDFNGQSREFLESSLNLELGDNAYHRPDNVFYEAVRMNSYEDVLEYADYAPDWCIIISEEAYKEHTDNGENVFYFLVRSDMQNVPRLPGKEFPKDEYGLSLMAVCVTPKGGISSITSRWNYGDDQDCFLTLSELELLVGRKIIDQMLNAVWL